MASEGVHFSIEKVGLGSGWVIMIHESRAGTYCATSGVPSRRSSSALAGRVRACELHRASTRISVCLFPVRGYRWPAGFRRGISSDAGIRCLSRFSGRGVQVIGIRRACSGQYHCRHLCDCEGWGGDIIGLRVVWEGGGGAASPG